MERFSQIHMVSNQHLNFSNWRQRSHRALVNRVPKPNFGVVADPIAFDVENPGSAQKKDNFYYHFYGDSYCGVLGRQALLQILEENARNQTETYILETSNTTVISAL